MSTFNEIVLKSHSIWKSKKKNPFTQISQAIDVNQWITYKILFLLFKFLPEYIPTELKERLIENHKYLLIGVSVLSDLRCLEGNKEYTHKVTFPVDMNDQEYSEWITGSKLFMEIAVETLTEDILFNAYKNKPTCISEWIFKALAYLGLFVSKESYRNHISYIILENAIKNFYQYKKILVINSLGNKDETTITINILAKEIGKNLTHAPKEMIESSEKAKKGSKLERVKYSFHSWGAYSINYPGVINIYIAGYIAFLFAFAFELLNLSSSKALSTGPIYIGLLHLVIIIMLIYWGLYGLGSLTRTVVHEICHYFTHDTDRFAFHKTVIVEKTKDSIN